MEAERFFRLDAADIPDCARRHRYFKRPSPLEQGEKPDNDHSADRAA